MFAMCIPSSLGVSVFHPFLHLILQKRTFVLRRRILGPTHMYSAAFVDSTTYFLFLFLFLFFLGGGLIVLVCFGSLQNSTASVYAADSRNFLG